MKLRILLPAFLLILGIALGAVSHASADYVLWTPTTPNDQNVFSYNLTPQNCTMTADLYINAAGATQGVGNTGNALLLQNLGTQSFVGTDFTISQNSGSWYVYNANNVQLLDLGSTNQFGLYYYYNGGILQPTITDVSNLPDQWLLNSGQCDPVLVVDAAPNQTVGSATPIPGTFMLFGSGLAGVIGFLRRFAG